MRASLDLRAFPAANPILPSFHRLVITRVTRARQSLSGARRRHSTTGVQAGNILYTDRQDEVNADRLA